MCSCSKLPKAASTRSPEWWPKRSLTPLKSSRSIRTMRETSLEPRRPLHLRVEHRQEAPPVDESRQVVGDRLALNQIVQARVLERDSGLGREPLGELPRLGREALRRRVEHELGTSCSSSADRSSRSSLRVPPGSPIHPSSSPSSENPRAPRPGRLRDHVEDHRHQRAGVVRGGERVAHERERRPCVRLPTTTSPTPIVTRLGGPDQLVLGARSEASTRAAPASRAWRARPGRRISSARRRQG